jgi:hypothetical protein
VGYLATNLERGRPGEAGAADEAGIRASRSAASEEGGIGIRPGRDGEDAARTAVGASGDPGKWIAPRGKSLEFRAPRRQEDTFIPFYRLGLEESYEMYFDLGN